MDHLINFLGSKQSQLWRLREASHIFSLYYDNHVSPDVSDGGNLPFSWASTPLIAEIVG